MYQEKSNVGNIIALCGGVLAGLSFFSFPYISLGFFGSYTAVQLANGIFGASMPALWLELLVALGIIALSSLALYNHARAFFSARLTLALSSVTLVIVFLIYAAQSSQSSFFGSASSFYASGFWFYAIGILTALVGAIIQIRR